MAVLDRARLADDALSATIALHTRMRGQLGPVLEAAQAVVDALRAGRKLLIFGNGGSAADAQHVAAELVGRFLRDRPAMAAIALTTDTSVLTSVANDYSFAHVFARQIEALGQAGDVACGISTSGMSANVEGALHAARARGLRTMAFTGHDGGRVGQIAEIHVNVPDDSAPRVQEVHRTLLHVMCELIEEALSSQPSARS